MSKWLLLVICSLVAALLSTASAAAVIPANQKGVTWHWQSWQQKDGSMNWNGVAEDLHALHSAGITWARVHIGPEMSDALTSRLASMAAANKVHLLALVADTASSVAQEPPSYLAQLARMYAGRIDAWEIGNEENNSEYWPLKDGRAAAVKHYVLYLQAAHKAMKQASPGATVLMGGLMGYNVEAFLPDFIRLGGGKYTDGFSIHPYAADPAAVMKRLAAIEKEIASDAELRDKPVWITEIGFYANEPAWKNAGRVANEATKAKYLSETIRLLRKSGVGAPIFWYNFHDSKPGVCGYSLVLFDPNGHDSALPAYDAYLHVSPSGSGPSLANGSMTHLQCP